MEVVFDKCGHVYLVYNHHRYEITIDHNNGLILEKDSNDYPRIILPSGELVESTTTLENTIAKESFDIYFSEDEQYQEYTDTITDDVQFVFCTSDKSPVYGFDSDNEHMALYETVIYRDDRVHLKSCLVNDFAPYRLSINGNKIQIRTVDGITKSYVIHMNTELTNHFLESTYINVA